MYDRERDLGLIEIYGSDSCAYCIDFSAQSRELLGFQDQAGEDVAELMAHIRLLDHPLTSATALVHVCMLLSYQNKAEETLSYADEAIRLSDNYGIPFRKIESEILKGWALAKLGKTEEGVALARRGLEGWNQTGALVATSWWLGLLAQALAAAGDFDGAISTLDESLSFAADHREGFVEPELHRLKGEVLLAQAKPDASTAQSCFREAIGNAETSKAKLWELRAATSLAKLWQSQGKTREAHDLLAPVYGWFTEGFDTADLKDAKALLAELGSV
jgi:predicted ATPase